MIENTFSKNIISFSDYDLQIYSLNVTPSLQSTIVGNLSNYQVNNITYVLKVGGLEDEISLLVCQYYD
jgi:hypothetical protein